MRRLYCGQEFLNNLAQVDEMKVGKCEVVFTIDYNDGDKHIFVDTATITQFKQKGEFKKVAYFTIPEHAQILGYM